MRSEPVRTFGLMPGQPMPEAFDFEGMVYESHSKQAAVVYLSDSPSADKPPERLLVLANAAGMITGIQWARQGESLIGPAELVLDFIVPVEAFKEPATPDPERLTAGMEIQTAVDSGDVFMVEEALVSLIEAEKKTDRSFMRGPLIAGVIDSGMDHLIGPSFLDTAREPGDVGEYTIYFTARVPGEDHFPAGAKQWGWASELRLGRSGWYTAVIMPIFMFFDFEGITEDGFDRTIRYHDYAEPREARVRCFGERRVRIDARILSGSTEVK